MQILTIELKNNKALKLIEQLEALQLIRIVRKDASSKGRKLSERLAGSLSHEQAEQMRRELHEMRTEWERDI